jgi:hypothetical protein
MNDGIITPASLLLQMRMAKVLRSILFFCKNLKKIGFSLMLLYEDFRKLDFELCIPYQVPILSLR